jgi:hypothetical protein
MYTKLYNKYFKDYQDAQPSVPQVRVPKTIEEYRQILLEDKIKQYAQDDTISKGKIIQLEKDRAEWQQVIEEREAVAQALATLKASAKAKLIAGEPLTAEEANTLII